MRDRFLIVSDGKAGHVNQSKSLCEGLGFEYDMAEVRYKSRGHKACSYLLDRIGLRTPSLFDVSIPAGGYKAVVGTGSTSFYPIKVLARAMKLPTIAILTPRGYRMDFDCILAPSFDRPPKRHNLITLPVNLTPTRADYYARGVKAFRERHISERPAVGVIIGGPNPFASMRAADLERDFRRLFAATEGHERWVTTSRRTPPDVDALVDSLPFDYKLVFSRDTFNPIPAFVTLCETLYVTGDSTGMISEAVTHGGAAVEILMNLSDSRSKFGRLVNGLVDAGVAHVFDGTPGRARRKIDLAPTLKQVAKLLNLS